MVYALSTQSRRAPNEPIGRPLSYHPTLAAAERGVKPVKTLRSVALQARAQILANTGVLGDRQGMRGLRSAGWLHQAQADLELAVVSATCHA